jgi:hypothetical protein
MMSVDSKADAEAAIKFSALFTKNIRAAAQWRLDQADKKLSTP